MGRIRSADWDRAGQAYGELVAARAFLCPADARAGAELAAAIAAGDDGVAVRTGVAFACANLWRQPGCRRPATDALASLIPGADGPLARAAPRAFTAGDDLPPDDSTGRLLRAVTERAEVLARAADSGLFERLERLLPQEAEPTYRICRGIVRQRGRDLGSIQQSWALHAANITNVALTLQRLECPFRGAGPRAVRVAPRRQTPRRRGGTPRDRLAAAGAETGVLLRRHRRRRASA
ncbi:MAG: hypothetical protein C0501_22905 [Isosphaera sp.]|nr:hypothetical protein [Isosphaera sp.]